MKRKNPTPRHVPKNVAKRILERCARDEPLVIVPRNGAPSRCYGLEEYQRMREHPLKHKPWKSRKASRASTPDPLGAVQGKVRSLLRREDIYDE
jgi:hypothetical protein